VERTFGRNVVEWTLDAEGRPVSARGTLREVFSDLERSSDELRAQRQVVRETGVEGDQGGHLVGHRFMGDQGNANLFAQNRNFNVGAFETLENDYARFVNNGYEVQFSHTLGDFSAAGRPGSLTVEYRAVNPQTGEVFRSYAQTFQNQAGQTYRRQYYPNNPNRP